MPAFFIFNHQYYKEGEPVIRTDNRSFRYGDGLFETMRVVDGSIALAEYHFERLFEGMEKMKFETVTGFNPVRLAEEILTLCKKNNMERASRVRLMVFRGNGGLLDPENLQPNFVVHSKELQHSNFTWNEKGKIIDVYADARKGVDVFSSIKTNNFLPYIMASLHAKEKKLDDCLLMNHYGRVADATTANIFAVTRGKIITPALSEGCVAGVMRRFIMEDIGVDGFDMDEGQFETNDLLEADEIFLTNAVRGIRWVEQFRNKKYKHEVAGEIFNALNKKIR